MDLHFIIPHLISGCIPVMTALTTYFVVLHVLGKKQKHGHILLSFLFCFYLVGILTVTGICLKGDFSPRIVYIPFLDMIRGPIDTVLNILLFLPMGLFLPVLYDAYDRVAKIALVGFFISLSIEIVQMFGMGATDINDLMTNTLGACLGYGIFAAFQRYIPKSLLEQTQVKGSQCRYELLFFWIGSMLIMLSIQIQIFHALFDSNLNNGDIQIWE